MIKYPMPKYLAAIERNEGKKLSEESSERAKFLNLLTLQYFRKEFQDAFMRDHEVFFNYNEQNIKYIDKYLPAYLAVVLRNYFFWAEEENLSLKEFCNIENEGLKLTEFILDLLQKEEFFTNCQE